MAIDLKALTPKQLLVLWEEMRYVPPETPRTRAELEAELVHRRVRPITDHSDSECVIDVPEVIVADTAFFVEHSKGNFKVKDTSKPRKTKKVKRKTCKKKKSSR